METAQIECACAMERKFDRRAARAKRSKWLGKLLFSLLGMSLFLTLRLNPEFVTSAMSAFQGIEEESAPPTATAPADAHVRRMPGGVVPVRRGNSLPGDGKSASQIDGQSEADAVGAQLRDLSPTR